MTQSTPNKTHARAGSHKKISAPPSHVLAGGKNLESCFGGGFSGGFSGGFGENQANTNIKENPIKDVSALAVAMQALDEEQEKINQQCLAIIAKKLCEPTTVATIRNHIKASDASSDYGRYIAGIQAYLSAFEAGALVKTTELAKQLSEENDGLPNTFLRDKVKPLLEQQNILLKNQQGGFVWASLETLDKVHCTEQNTNNSNAPSTTSVTKQCNSIITRINEHWDTMRRNSAKRDPYKKVLRNGDIQILNKPYTGEMSEEEKRILREFLLAKKTSKMLALTEKMNNRKFIKELADIEKATARQEVEIEQQARNRVAEIRANRAISSANLAGYTPFFIAAIVIAFVLVVVNIKPENSPQKAPSLEAAIMEPWDNE